MSVNCWAVLPAAGIGSRMGSALPKQYIEIAGATIFEHSLRALLACRELVAVVVALHPDDKRAADLAVMNDTRVQTVVGGRQRSDSVLAGLAALSGQAAADDWVLVHDAARPCLQKQECLRLITQVIDSGTGGILAQPVVDTVKRADANGMVAATVDRKLLWQAQTPQMFRLGELQQALQQAAANGLAVTDEASAMEMAGYPVQLIAGSARNLKVTVPADLQLATWYLQATTEDNRA